MVTLMSRITQKDILDSQGCGIIKFDVTGSVSNRIDECRNKTKIICKKISDILGLDETLIEIQRPRKIPNGLTMIINIHLNHIQNRRINYEKALMDLNQNGSLTEILKMSWDLKTIPIVSSFEFQVKESKDRKENAVEIKINTQSIDKELQSQKCSLPLQPAIKNITEDGKIEIKDDEESVSTQIIYNNNTNEIEKQEWSCSICTFINNHHGLRCEMCGGERENKNNKQHKNDVELYKIEGFLHDKPEKEDSINDNEYSLHVTLEGQAKDAAKASKLV